MGSLQKNNALHAAGGINTDGTVRNAGSGNWSSARIGAGVYDITLNDPIDALERTILVTPKTDTIVCQLDAASDTDTVFRIGCRVGGGAFTDSQVEFLVVRSRG